MILLTSTNDKLQLVTSAVGDVEVQASYVDLSGSTVTPGRTNSNIATATTTDIIGSPAAATQRNAKLVSIFNNSATASNTVTVIHTDGTTAVNVVTLNLSPQAGVQYTDRDGWTTYGAMSALNIQTFPASGTWRKPQTFTASVALVRCWGAGGGGGGGASLSTAVMTKGGAGAGGGCRVEQLFPTSALTADVAVTIGAGGSSGGGAAAGGSGSAGGVGGNTTFGAFVTAYGGGGGAGGANSAANVGGGGGGGGLGAGGSGSGGTVGTGGLPTSAGPGFDMQGITGVNTTSNVHYGWAGGGGGGGSNVTPSSSAGGGSVWGGGGGGSGGHRNATPAVVSPEAGGGIGSFTTGGGLAGVSGPVPIAGGNGLPSNGISGGTGGGGGGSTVTASTSGTAGGVGGLGGGGGGGGGAGNNPGTGGAGGIGGDGYCVVYAW